MRAVIGALLALVFFVAVTPGTMAMPSPQKAPVPVMAMTAAMAGHCHHMTSQKDQDTPCKGMKVCVGLLGCLGLAAIATEHPVLPAPAPAERACGFSVVAAGLTHPPDTPPPIA